MYPKILPIKISLVIHEDDFAKIMKMASLGENLKSLALNLGKLHQNKKFLIFWLFY